MGKVWSRQKGVWSRQKGVKRSNRQKAEERRRRNEKEGIRTRQGFGELKITIFARNVSPDKSKSYFKSSEIPLYTANKSNRARKLKTFLCHLSIFGPKKERKSPIP